jgi:hypothetical protein
LLKIKYELYGAGAMIGPRASIRRFDIFAEYNRLKKHAEGAPDDVAKGYGLWLAKVIAARKFGRISPEKAREILAPLAPADAVRTRFRRLGDVEQSGALFDKEIVERMGRTFYRQVFQPAIRDAFQSGKSYVKIRDALRKDWQVEAEDPEKGRKKGR